MSGGPDGATSSSASPAEVDDVFFLARDVALIVGTAHASDEPTGVTLAVSHRRIPLEHDVLVLEHGYQTGRVTWMLMAVIPTHEVDAARSASMLVQTPRSTLAAGAPALAFSATAIQSLVVDVMAELDGDCRANIGQWISGFAGRASSVDCEQLADSLYNLREVLRERLPLCEPVPGERQGLSVDLVLAADERTFYLKGWSRNVGAPLARLTAVSPEGHRVDLHPGVFRHRREDVADFYAPYTVPHEATDYGFIASCELPGPSVRNEGWVVEMTDVNGIGVEALGPPVQRDVTAVRQLVLQDAVYERPGEDWLRAGHLAPTLMRLQDRWHRNVDAARVDDYGTPPVDPEVTVIVPLFQRLEYLEHQLAQFVHDDEILANELLYVLDSPGDEAWLRQLAMTLFELYRVPFRTVVMSHNGGFAAANNVGASIARGRKLMLLNSDVLPDRPGWLARMVRFYDETPDIGALGVKLLYEDDSLQHAGLYFKRTWSGDAWNNEHLFKGLHRSFPGANVARKVPAVTAACMMVDRQLLRDIGGLSTAYVQGDYEDSDLCLRLAKHGKETWYLPSVELYHLEGQSYPSVLRLQTSDYNRWLHTHLRGDDIEALAASWDATPPPAAPEQ